MIKILHERVSNRRAEYEAYLEQHIGGVKKAYEQFKDVLLTESDLTVEDVTNLDSQIEMHDASKYEDEEFFRERLKKQSSGEGKRREERKWCHRGKFGRSAKFSTERNGFRDRSHCPLPDQEKIQLLRERKRAKKETEKRTPST